MCVCAPTHRLYSLVYVDPYVTLSSYLCYQVENTIRWRYIEDEDGNTLRESNAKMVKWSDGT